LAEQVHAGAQYKLGMNYYTGDGVTQNYTTAAELYQYAADQGHAGAQYKLGNMYIDGDGVTQNYEMAA
jgi:uncharacterized protein